MTERSRAPGALCALVFWALPLSLAAQQQPPQTNPTYPLAAPASATPLPTPTIIVPGNIQPDLVSPAAPANYVIGPNDLLSIFVYQMPEMTRQVRVDSNGDIRIPFARSAFEAAGKTARQVQREVGAGLLAQGLVRDPLVQVTVVQVESRPIVVGGAVQRPLVLQASRPMRLLEVLADAGGITAAAGNNVLISRQVGGANLPTSQIYDLSQLIRFNNPKDDPLLTGNEMVTVMPAQLVYVVGDFKQPGAFPITMGEPITVLRAIALGKGLDANPNKGAAEIIRTTAAGVRTEIPVKIDKILAHRAPDVGLQPGDILYVSKNTKREVLVDALADTAQVLTLGAAYHFP